MAAPASKTLDIRWMRRYRLFWTAGVVILTVQVFLAYVFLTLDTLRDNPNQEYLSGRGRLNVESADENGLASPRRFREMFTGDDEEEDSIGNSNAVYTKVKLPPDKLAKTGKHAKSGKTGETNKTVALRVEELDFTPMCEIKSKEAISAIHRARTQNCKQQIANTTCLINSGELYPSELPHQCPAPESTKGKSLGCYSDDKMTRVLKDHYVQLKTTNSPLYCINICIQGGYPYAGVEFGSECFCGSNEPSSSTKLPDSSCNMKCPADPKQACGGFYAVNIYQTGVARMTKEPVVETWMKKGDTQLRNKDAQVRIVFLLTLNGRAVRQVKRLIKALYHSSHFFYIHVDARQDYMMRELLQLELRHSNVRLSRRRHATIWGGASLLTMLLEAMADLVQSGWQWDFVINLSESDYPVKTNDQLVDFLTANRDRNFVKSHGHEVQRFIQKQGLDKTFVECDAHMWRIGDRTLPDGIVIDGGSDWLALSRSFVEYLASGGSETLVQGLTTVFKHTLLPAESFFHTVLRNSMFCESYVNNNLHVTNWKRKLGCKCQYKHIVDWCGCSPNDFRIDDWQRVVATEAKPVFFARKFEPIVDQGIVNQLDAWLYGAHPPDLPGLNSYWQSIYSVHDLGPSSDDALISLGLSLARAAFKNTSSNNCSLTSTRLVEITSYHKLDYYQGSLIMFEAKPRTNMAETTVKVETWIKPIDHFAITGNNGPSQKLKAVYVSSNFDQKEQQSRNNLRWMGPFTEPVAVYETSSSNQLFNVTLLWIDPMANVAAVSDLIMEEGSTVGFVKPGLKSPLLPGTWTLKLYWNSSIFAHTLFLVLPLEQVSGSPLSLHQAQFVHGGPGERYTKLNSDWTKIAGLQFENRTTLERRAFSNTKRVGKDLNIWIDTLTSKFYQVIESCGASISSLCGLKPCASTFWSSLSPDPKSELRSMDKSGRINRW
ncbi:Xylosyltransferase sqv-6 [Nesidiocoris tenuis]|uniref:protein xylosyltransferase n=1 Tax=Nesidiocoris tenuis TaxID=355587 RepID=A0ABN7BFF2_9HEMI|nr:Xylosyltransferase sqv-6 [Nesidiocoris tenuis]